MKKLLGAILLTMIAATAAQADVPVMPGPAAPNLARIYVYREFGNYQYLAWTAVWFNADRVGDSAPGTYFYRDVPPGTYTISLRSERPYPDQFQTVTVRPGSTTYVRVAAVEEYALNVPPVHMHHMHFDGIQVQAPNTFVDTVMDPMTALPVITKLQPMS